MLRDLNNKNGNSKEVDLMRKSAINEFQIDHRRKENETTKLVPRNFVRLKSITKTGRCILKYVTDLVGDRCRGCQTMIRSSVLEVASQTWVVEPLVMKRKY